MTRTFRERFFLAFLLCFLLAVFSPGIFAHNIVVLGDSQLNEDIQRRVVQAIVPFNPVAVFRVGDNVNDGNDLQQWIVFNRINEPLLNSADYFPALGNHEQNSPLYFKNFPFLKGQRWYSVEREGIHFIVLDSNASLSPESEQYRWLRTDLAGIKPQVKFRIALFHHPLFSLGSHTDNEKGWRQILLPLFQQYGVRAVFSGHEHSYQRLEYDGITFIVTGGGGSTLVDRSRQSPYLKKFVKTHHFCLLSPRWKFLQVQVINMDSKVIDEFSIPALP